MPMDTLSLIVGVVLTFLSGFVLGVILAADHYVQKREGGKHVN